MKYLNQLLLAFATVASTFTSLAFSGNLDSETKAKADVAAITSGKLPVHAKRDIAKPDLGDGGTTFWKGEGYDLTIQKRLTSKDGKPGIIYGPIVVFKDPAKAEISDLKFYSVEDLNKLLGKPK